MEEQHHQPSRDAGDGCVIGDGKEVGDFVKEDASKAKLLEKHRRTGDSQSIEPFDKCEKPLKTDIFSEISVCPRTPGSVRELDEAQRSVPKLPLDENRVHVDPLRKGVSTFVMRSTESSDLVKDSSVAEDSISESSNKSTGSRRQGTPFAAKLEDNSSSKKILPRKVVSVDANITQRDLTLMKTHSVGSNLRQIDELPIGESLVDMKGQPDETSLNVKPGKANISATTSCLLERNVTRAESSLKKAVTFKSSVEEVDGWDDTNKKVDVSGNWEEDAIISASARGLCKPSDIPDLIEAFLDDGNELDDLPDDDLMIDTTTKEATTAGLGKDGVVEPLAVESRRSRATHKVQQSQSQTSLTAAVGAAMLQNTCDLSSWSLCHYHSLPQWMQDNEFILSCHRPPLPSFFACFKSIFRLHTETLNIWTHLLGCVAFVAMGAYFLALPREAVWLQEKLAFGAFFGGGAACFALSSAYHTLWCHSPAVGRLFSKLDYCGIALLIMGSFVPWLYYAFYCRGRLLLAYLALVAALGALSVLVSLWGRFGEPRFRPLRAGVFLAYGLSGVVPALHFAATEGWRLAIAQASLHWLALMGALYVAGACVYALRVPERFFPGRCDLLFQSHQIFHVFVIAAALVHYHGLSEMAVYRLSFTDCASRALA